MIDAQTEDLILSELEAVRWEITAEYRTLRELCDYLRSREPDFASQMAPPRFLPSNSDRAARGSV